MPFSVMQLRITALLLIAGLILSGCGTGNNSLKNTPTTQVRQDLLATFTVTVPALPEEGTQIALEWVNPLGVHELNPARLILDKVDDQHFQVDVPVKKGTLLQYRYVKTGSKTAVETGADGKPIVSRFYSITSHSRIQDIILGFDSSTINPPTGRIEGKIVVQGSQKPVSGILITIAGVTGESAIDGSFQIKKIPIGTQNLTIFSPDSLFEPIQQQAVIEENNVTPIDVELVPKKLVNVTFILKAPANTPAHADIRLFGSTISLGNSYAGLFGGTNPVQTRAPVLTRQSEHEFILVAPLPVETEIKYVYSLGDTFWNKETTVDGLFPTRTYYVPQQDSIINDQISSWETPKSGAVTFQFSSPKNTNANDVIQIQFNAFGWMDPLQMWPVGNGTYEFTLFSPLNFSDSIKYRFCRSSICGTIDPNTSSEYIGSFKATTEPQVLTTPNVLWNHFVVTVVPTVVSTESSDPKSSNYLTAIEFSDSFRVSWLPYYPAALDAVKALNANTIILPFTWTFQSANPVWLTPVLSHNPTVEDIKLISIAAHERGLKIFLQPKIQFSTSADDFWNEFGKTDIDWGVWFESVSNFYVQTALLAQQIDAAGIILGDEQISQIIAESESITPLAGKYPSDSMAKWNDIFKNIKNTSHLPIYLALRFDDFIHVGVADIKDIAGLYLLDLGQIPEKAEDPRQSAEIIGKKLDESLMPILTDSDLKVWIGLDFPSVSYSETVCITYPTQCVSPEIFNFPAPEQPGMQISLQAQTNLYNSAIPEINRREWIGGLSSRRFLVPGGYQDQSSSIRGKPASDVIWYWYSQMSGNRTQ
jgi:hypothetical protein